MKEKKLTNAEIGAKIRAGKNFTVATNEERKSALAAAKFNGVEIQSREITAGKYRIRFLTELATSLLFLAVNCGAMDRFDALAAIEHDPRKPVGSHGEVSHYQIMPDVWRQYAHADESPTNQWQALAVVMRIQSCRAAIFAAKHGRLPNDAEWSLLFHAPAHVMKPNQEERDYAKRFCNLLSK